MFNEKLGTIWVVNNDKQSLYKIYRKVYIVDLIMLYYSGMVCQKGGKQNE